MQVYQNSFRKLIVWQEAKKLTLQIYEITKTFPSHELYGITSQIRRAASSIMANIAEGNNRETTKDTLNFLITARASLSEVDCFLELAFELKYLNQQQYSAILEPLNKTAFLLKKLITSFRNRISPKSPNVPKAPNNPNVPS